MEKKLTYGVWAVSYTHLDVYKRQVGASRRFLAQITRHQNEVKFMSASLQYSNYAGHRQSLVWASPSSIVLFRKSVLFRTPEK